MPVALLLLAALVVVSLPTTVPLAGRIAARVRDRFADRVALAPGSERASSSAAGTAPELVADGLTNRYWAPAGEAEDAWIELDLPAPAYLLDLTITPGVSTQAERYLAQGRPDDLAVRVVAASGEATGTTVHLADQPGPQAFPVRVAGAVRIRLTIVTTYGMPPGRLCAVGEVEIHVRR
jgi:hypothetical protein